MMWAAEPGDYMGRIDSRKHWTMLVVAVSLSVGGCAGMTVPQYGVHEGQLASCDDQRGCVSSQSSNPDHFVEPIIYRSGRHEARAHLLIVLKSWPNAKLVSNHRTYLRVEFPSVDSENGDGPTVMGSSANIDETEFYLPTDQRVIHLRSAPRRNFPDDGTNRARIEAIRAKFESLQN